VLGVDKDWNRYDRLRPRVKGIEDPKGQEGHPFDPPADPVDNTIGFRLLLEEFQYQQVQPPQPFFLPIF
jgi:hypothetical protein